MPPKKTHKRQYKKRRTRRTRRRGGSGKMRRFLGIESATDETIIDPNDILQTILEQFRGIEEITPITINDETDTYTIENEPYRIDKQLGKGAFGTVYLIERDTTDEPKQKRAKSAETVAEEETPTPKLRKAIKEIDLSRQIENSMEKHKLLTPAEHLQKQVAYIVNEIHLLKQIREHCADFFICYEKVYYRITDTNKFMIYIVTEYLQGDSLSDYVEKREQRIRDENARLPKTEAKHPSVFSYISTIAKPDMAPPIQTAVNNMNEMKMGVIHKLCDAVANLHMLRIAHRDIKPDNIYIYVKDGKYHIKLIDFGLSETIEESKSYKYKGTPVYSLPELYYTPCNDYKMVIISDLWAVGLVAFMLFDIRTFRKLKTRIFAQMNNSAKTPMKIFTIYEYLKNTLKDPESEISHAYNRFIELSKEKGYLTVDLRNFILAALGGPSNTERFVYNKLLLKPAGWRPKVKAAIVAATAKSSTSSSTNETTEEAATTSESKTATGVEGGTISSEEQCSTTGPQYVMTSSGKIYDLRDEGHNIPEEELENSMYAL